MRRIKGTYILIPLFCTLLCIGCDNEDTTLMPTQPIGFSTSVDDSNTRADSDTDAATRAEATTANLTEIGVFAYNTGSSDFDPSASSANLMNNQSVKKENGTWTYSPVKFWPANPNDKVSFFAYAPHTANVPAGDQIRIDRPTPRKSGSPIIRYNTGLGELDLLLSTGVMNCTNNHGPVQFTMKHALTKVILKVKVESGASKLITTVGIDCAKVAYLRIDDANTGIILDKYENTNTSTCYATVNQTADGTAKTMKELFLTPKHIPDAKVKLEYVKEGTTTTTIEATLPNADDWAPGKAIGYTLTLRENQTLDITVEADMAWEKQEKPEPTDGQYTHIIKTAEDLAEFRDDVNFNNKRRAKAIQMADIDLQDLTKSSLYPTDAKDWLPIGLTIDNGFRGVYNGNGYAIRNLKINGLRTDHNYTYADAYGLFGYITSEARLVGIHLRDVDITFDDRSQKSIINVGALVGTVNGTGTETHITACSATGKIGRVTCFPNYNDTSTPPFATGGLIGSSTGNILISFCHAGVNIGENGIFNRQMDTYGHNACSVGGFIGYISTAQVRGCNIVACQASGNIKLGDFNPGMTHIINVGGFLGSNKSAFPPNICGNYSSGNIAISFLTGFISSATPRVLSAGGFAGVLDAIICSSCYSSTSLALTHPSAINGSPIGDFYFGGFAGTNTSQDSYIKYNYGDGQTLPKPSDFAGQTTIYSNGFAPINPYRPASDCYSYTTLAGKTVQEVITPDNPVGSRYEFWFIDYDPSTHSYFLNNRSGYWTSDKGWKQTPADPMRPEINYDLLNITP